MKSNHLFILFMVLFLASCASDKITSLQPTEQAAAVETFKNTYLEYTILSPQRLQYGEEMSIKARNQQQLVLEKLTEYLDQSVSPPDKSTYEQKKESLRDEILTDDVKEYLIKFEEIFGSRKKIINDLMSAKTVLVEFYPEIEGMDYASVYSYLTATPNRKD